MTTWSSLKQQIDAGGVTAEVATATRALFASPMAYMRALSGRARQDELDAQLAVLFAIKKHLSRHSEHAPSARRYIADRDVVVTGHTDDNGVPVTCSDPVCRAWFAWKGAS